MTLRAYIDDSGNGGPPLFVLAGYIAPAESWARFSDDWQAVLDMPPPLTRFKMNEALRWGEEQWNTRLPLLYKTIENHVSAGISLSIPYSEYRSVFAGKKYAKNPYHFAFSDIIAQVARHQHLLGISEPIDFIFDKGNDERIARAWDGFFKHAPDEYKYMLGQRPQFGDDEAFLPLQAADLYAWWVRRKRYLIHYPDGNHRPAPWTKSRDLLYLEMEWTVDRIQKAYDGLYGDSGKRSE